MCVEYTFRTAGAKDGVSHRAINILTHKRVFKLLKEILAKIVFFVKKKLETQGYLVLGFLSILSEKSRFGDRSDSGKS